MSLHRFQPVRIVGPRSCKDYVDARLNLRAGYYCCLEKLASIKINCMLFFMPTGF